jgi:Polysaccharide lyase
MNLPGNSLPTPLRLLAIAFLGLLALAALAVGHPTAAGAKVKVVAKAAADAPEAVRVVAHTPEVAQRIEFFVDGRRQSVKRSVDWRHGRKGLLEVQPGRHRLTAVAIHPGGEVSRGVRIIRLARKQGGGKIGIRPAKPVSEPKPAPTPPSLPPGVLFDGGFDNGFESWHVQALDYRVSLFNSGAFSGGAAHFEVHGGDVEPETGSERAEVSGPTFHEGQDLYVRDTIRVPSSSSSSTEWQLIQQLRENDWGGSPGMAVFLEDDLEIEIGAGDGYPMYWEDTELEPNRWYDLVYRVYLSQDPKAGFVEVWLDGVQQKLLNGQSRMYGQTIQRSSNYLKTGVYRSESSTGTTVVEHDNVIVGTGYDAVMAAG